MNYKYLTVALLLIGLAFYLGKPDSKPEVTLNQILGITKPQEQEVYFCPERTTKTFEEVVMHNQQKGFTHYKIINRDPECYHLMFLR